MKHRILYIRWLVTALMLSTLPAMAEVRDTVDFDFVERTFEHITVDGETFIRYSFPDCDQIDQTGAPMLPVKYIRLSVPYNATNITVRPLASWTPANENKRIYPAPVPIPTDGSVTEEPGTVIDSTIYMTDAYWPPSAAELVGDGYYMGENRIVTIAVYPMLYNPVQNKMHNYTQVRVKVSYDLGPTPAGMLVRYNPQLRQQERQQAMALVSNPELVEAHAVPAATVQHMMQQNPDTTNWPVPGYEYMVITTRELAPAFKRLIALKQQKGYRAGVVCVEDIVNDPLVQNGDKCMLPDSTYSYINDDAGKIRQYLRENFDYGTKYVLFGGDSVPFRYGYAESTNNYTGYALHHKKVPTDTYYCDFNSNWNVDGDDYYGEMKFFSKNGRLDLEPELFVGRLMFYNTETVANYTEKLLRYEISPGHGNTSYLKRIVLTQCKPFKTASLLASFYYCFWQNQQLFIDSGLNNPTATDVINYVNLQPAGIMSLEGHGNPWAVFVNYTKNNGRCIVTLDTITYPVSYVETCGLDMMQNKYYPNVMYSYACTTTPFDNYEESDSRKYPGINFGQSFTLGKNYGGVAFLGNTRVGYADTTLRLSSSSLLEKKFVESISAGHHKLGEIEAVSKSIYDGSMRNYIGLVHNLMGDPECDIWTDEPTTINVITTARFNNSIVIEVLNNENDTLVYGLSDGINQLMGASSSGSITFSDVNPNSTVMVYQHNYLPYIAPLFLQNERVERSQYVIANDVYAGRNVDSNRTVGDLTIAVGSEYEIESKGQVVLAPGFKVEKGALFSVTQSDY